MNNPLIIALSVFAAILALTVVGSDDIAEAEAARYCERVELGIHRDWNADIQCTTKAQYQYKPSSRTIAVM